MLCINWPNKPQTFLRFYLAIIPCDATQSAVVRLHVVCLFVRLSDRDVEV